MIFHSAGCILCVQHCWCVSIKTIAYFRLPWVSPGQFCPEKTALFPNLITLSLLITLQMLIITSRSSTVLLLHRLLSKKSVFHFGFFNFLVSMCYFCHHSPNFPQSPSIVSPVYVFYQLKICMYSFLTYLKTIFLGCSIPVFKNLY